MKDSRCSGGKRTSIWVGETQGERGPGRKEKEHFGGFRGTKTVCRKMMYSEKGQRR